MNEVCSQHDWLQISCQQAKTEKFGQAWITQVLPIQGRKWEYSEAGQGPKQWNSCYLFSFFTVPPNCLPLSDNGIPLHSITWMNTSDSCLRESKISFLTASVFRFLSCSMFSQASWKGVHVQFILAVRTLDVRGKENSKANWNTFAVFFFIPYSGPCTKLSCPHLLQV